VLDVKADDIDSLNMMGYSLRKSGNPNVPSLSCFHCSVKDTLGLVELFLGFVPIQTIDSGVLKTAERPIGGFFMFLSGQVIQTLAASRHFVSCIAFLILLSGGELFAGSASGAKLYVGLFRENSVAVVDTVSNQILKRIPVPSGPEGMVISHDDKIVYVSSSRGSEVTAIDTNTDTIKASIDVGSKPQGLALTPDDSTLLVASFESNRVLFIDTHKNIVVLALPVEKPHTIAVAPDGKTAFIASQSPQSPALVVLDLMKRIVVDTVALDKRPRALCFSPSGGRLYFTCVGSDSVQVLDVDTKKVAAEIPAGVTPHLVLFTADADTALVVSRGSNSLYFFDPDSNSLTGQTQVGDLPYWIAANGVAAWVSNENSNTVSVVDLYSQTVTATIQVGAGPRELVVQKRERVAEKD
jgi:YVTN family beta-propeller protein